MAFILTTHFILNYNATVYFVQVVRSLKCPKTPIIDGSTGQSRHINYDKEEANSQANTASPSTAKNSNDYNMKYRNNKGVT